MTLTTEHPAMEIMGIKFAPFDIPLNRRFQTFSLMAYVFLAFLLGIFLTPLIMLYMLFFTSYWYLVLLYFCWMIYDRDTPHNGGRMSNWLRTTKMCYALRDYFPVKLVKTTELPADNNYLFCAHPHGLICFGLLSNFGSDCNSKEVFPDLDTHIIALAAMFNVPIGRELFLAKGLRSATERGILSVIGGKKEGKVAVLSIGGAAEASYAYPLQNKIILNSRRGFIRMAMKAGVPIVPVYSFGENDIFDQYRSERLTKFQESVRKLLGVIPIVYLGRGIFQYSMGILPHRCPITTVVGKPIPVPKTENPAREELDKYHTIYKNELIKLFNENKGKYDAQGEKAELIII